MAATPYQYQKTSLWISGTQACRGPARSRQINVNSSQGTSGTSCRGCQRRRRRRRDGRRDASELMVRIAHRVLFQVTFWRNECYASGRTNEAFCRLHVRKRAREKKIGRSVFRPNLPCPLNRSPASLKNDKIRCLFCDGVNNTPAAPAPWGRKFQGTPKSGFLLLHM